ncbi:hypothetical protein I6H08_03175 [Burkholderia gladioli]|nr:hypothetical protein I6H08_03175 [Burkholderia gladioli]
MSAAYYVAPQISETDIREIAASGVRAIVCNPPDGESRFQPIGKN